MVRSPQVFIYCIHVVALGYIPHHPTTRMESMWVSSRTQKAFSPYMCMVRDFEFLEKTVMYSVGIIQICLLLHSLLSETDHFMSHGFIQFHIKQVRAILSMRHLELR